MVAGKKLRVTIGGSRFDAAIANVNDPLRPTEINTDLFVGRVLVRVKDFAGVTSDGAAPVSRDPYFDGRSRRFAIQIEGRFKAREGHAPYTADEIQFGSDFDRLVDFPRAAFNAGMKVAQWVDPATFYEEKPPTGRPFIMSPYAACMNTVAAWPAPERAADAVVMMRQADGEEDPGSNAGSTDDLVPVERKEGKSRKPIRHWHFLGFKSDPAVAAFVKPYAPDLLAPRPESTAQRPAISHKASLGVLRRGGASTDSPSSGTSTPASTKSTPDKKSSSGFGLGAMFSKASISSHTITADDFTTADKLSAPPAKAGVSTKLDAQLGPWRFGDEALDIIEDNSFVFIEKNIATAKRRKHFCEAHGKNRKDFVYSPDVVYATSFFTSYADLNTFDLSIGPVNVNLYQFHDMPIRYTLRSTRLVDTNGSKEEEVFATIAFDLVDA